MKYLYFLFSLLISNLMYAQEVSEIEGGLSYKRELKKIQIKNLRKTTRIEKPIYRRYGRNIKDIVFDFKTKRFIAEPYHSDTLSNPPYEIHEMDGISIRIKNINPFIHSVDLFELQGDQISNEKLLEVTQSSSLKLDIPTIKEFTISAIKLTNGTVDEDSITLKELISKLTRAQEAEGKLNMLETYRQERVNEIARAEFAFKNKLDPTSMLVDENFESSKLSQQFEISQRKIELGNLEKTIASKRVEITKLGLSTLDIGLEMDKIQKKLRRKPMDKLKVNRAIVDSIRNIRSLVTHINKFIFLHNQLVNSVQIAENTYDSIKAQTELLIAQIGFQDKNELVQEYCKTRNKILQSCDELHQLLDQVIELDSANELSYRLAQKDVSSFTEEFTQFDHNKLTSQITHILGLIKKEKFEVNYQTLSIAENADFIKYRIEIKPNSSAGVPLATLPYNLDISLLVNEGLKLDVSTGLVLDFNLADPRYYFQKFSIVQGMQSFDSVRVKVSPNTGNVTPSINLMLNAYKRSSLNFKPGFALGFGLSSDIRFRLYAGPTLIIGRRERISFSGGIAFGAILRNADGYSEGTKFADNSSIPSEVPMVQDSFKFGWYVGLGFNLSGKETKGFLEKIKFR